MFGRKRIKHPDASFYQYHYGEVFTNGAMEQAFESTFSNPVFSYRGAGRVAGALSPVQPAPLYMKQRAPVAGIPTTAGHLALTPLTDNPLGLGD